jgi:hypothetical protein
MANWGWHEGADLEGSMGTQATVSTNYNEKGNIAPEMDITADDSRPEGMGLELLRACMFGHDIEEVSKIRLSNMLEDTVAWHYERSG